MLLLLISEICNLVTFHILFFYSFGCFCFHFYCFVLYLVLIYFYTGAKRKIWNKNKIWSNKWLKVKWYSFEKICFDFFFFAHWRDEQMNGKNVFYPIQSNANHSNHSVQYDYSSVSKWYKFIGFWDVSVQTSMGDYQESFIILIIFHL